LLLAEQPGVYDFTVINDDLDKAYESLKSYLEKVCRYLVLYCRADSYFDVFDVISTLYDPE